MRFLSALLCCVAVTAQEPTFRSTTKLTIVNITVRDKGGKPVDNLNKADFELTEDGKPQQISVFEIEHLSGTPIPVAPAQQQALIPRGSAAPAAAATPGITAAVSRKDKRLLALFFDLSSMQPAEQLRAQEAATKFLREQMTSSDLVSILTFSNRLKVVEDFTDDRDRLLTDIQQFRIGDSSELAVDADTGADPTDDSGSFVPDDTEFNIFNTDRKLIALEDAAKRLGTYPEKKALIYFASGVSRTGIDNESQLRSTVNAAVRANVSFYPIDARGLIALPPGGDASTPSPKGTGVFTGSTYASDRNKIFNQQETLSTLASDTGGKALLDNNDLSVGIQQAQKDIESYYVLGYYSTNPAEDGKYRKIKVRIGSLPQAKLDYRPGYFAGKQFAKFTSSEKERQLDEALTLGDPVTDLPIALEVDYFRVARDKYFVPISVKIPGSSIDIKKEKADLDFIGQVLDRSGKIIGGVRDGISIKLDAPTAEKLAKRQLQYDTGVTLAPGEYKLRFLARENGTGKMGTFEAPFTVPDLGRQTSLHTSSIVWSGQREPLTASLGGTAKHDKLLAMHPLVQDGQKLVPSITRVFRKDQSLFVYFEVYDPGATPAPSLTAEIELFRGQKRVFETEPVRVTRATTSRPNTFSFEFQIPLAKLAAGNYVGQVNIIDEQSRKFAFSRAPLVLLP